MSKIKAISGGYINAVTYSEDSSVEGFAKKGDVVEITKSSVSNIKKDLSDKRINDLNKFQKMFLNSVSGGTKDDVDYSDSDAKESDNI